MYAHCTWRRSVMSPLLYCFFFNDTATTEIYTLSLHDALPIWLSRTTRTCASATSSSATGSRRSGGRCDFPLPACGERGSRRRSEEHTSELQSRQYLVCRLLLEKKKKTTAA